MSKMGDKIYYLSTCNTCQRIIKELEINENDFVFQDLKANNISEDELDFLQSLSGSYESLFNKRSIKYRTLELGKKDLNEEEIKTHILAEYTFLKRPTLLIDKQLYVGNAKKTVAAAKAHLDQKS